MKRQASVLLSASILFLVGVVLIIFSQFNQFNFGSPADTKKEVLGVSSGSSTNSQPRTYDKKEIFCKYVASKSMIQSEALSLFPGDGEKQVVYINQSLTQRAQDIQKEYNLSNVEWSEIISIENAPDWQKSCQ